MPTNAELTADTRAILSNQASLSHQYIPRREAPSTSLSCSARSITRYKILDRVPWRDSVPRYIIQKATENVPDPVNPALSVTAYDIHDYVSRGEIERYENARFRSGEDDFSSPQEWTKKVKLAKRKGLDIYRRYPSARVVLRRRRLDAVLTPMTTEYQKSDCYGQLKTSDGEVGPETTEYEVSAVLDHRDVMGLRWYLVAWTGSAESTWLSEEELESDRPAVENYWNQLDQTDSDLSAGIADEQNHDENRTDPLPMH